MGATMSSMPSLARRLAAIAVLLLSVAIVAFLGLRVSGILVPTPTPIPATPTAEPSASPNPVAVFSQIEEQVRALR